MADNCPQMPGDLDHTGDWCCAPDPALQDLAGRARHHAGHTLGFDGTVAWLAVACSKTAVCELMRIAWRTVGAIAARVWADAEKRVDRFANLRRIGIDEISYNRHHKYLTIVVDHDTAADAVYDEQSSADGKE